MTKTITAAEIDADMTLLVDGQHHLVEAVRHDGDMVWVQAETVVGNMGPRTFLLPADQQVTTL